MMQHTEGCRDVSSAYWLLLRKVLPEGYCATIYDQRLINVAYGHGGKLQLHQPLCKVNRAPNVFGSGFRPSDLDDNLCMPQKINRVALMAEQLCVARLNA